MCPHSLAACLGGGGPAPGVAERVDDRQPAVAFGQGRGRGEQRARAGCCLPAPGPVGPAGLGSARMPRQRDTRLAGQPRRFFSNVLGPRCEQVCRDWALPHAAPSFWAVCPPVSDTASSMIPRPAPATRSTRRSSESLMASSRRSWPSETPSGTTPWAWPTSTGSGTSALSSPRLDATTRPAPGSSSSAEPEFNDKAHAAAAAASDVQQIDLVTLYGHLNAARTDTRETASGSRAGTKCQIT